MGIIVSVVVLAALIMRKKLSDPMKRVILIFVSYVGFAVISISAGLGVNHIKGQQMRAYVEAVSPLVDQHFEKTGEYPATLELIDAPARPFVLGNSLRYYGRDQTFEFVYVDSRSLMGGVQLTSKDRKWTHWS